MAKFIATKKAYFGGIVVEVGTAVEWPDGKQLPSWLSKPDAAVVAAPAAKEAKTTGKPGKTKPETVAVQSAEPFADAPEPVRVHNEVNAALGTTEPDWVRPSAKAKRVAV